MFEVKSMTGKIMSSANTARIVSSSIKKLLECSTSTNKCTQCCRKKYGKGFCTCTSSFIKTNYCFFRVLHWHYFIMDVVILKDIMNFHSWQIIIQLYSGFE